MEPRKLFLDVLESIPAYARFARERDIGPDAAWESIPLCDKHNYLLDNPVEDLCRGGLDDCFLIGASSGFSGSGTVYWPKRAEDERHYVEAVKGLLTEQYGIDKKRTLVLVCLAFGTWIGGMQLATACRTLAAGMNGQLTVATPGLNLAEAVDILGRFHQGYDQALCITNVSNVSLVAALVEREGLALPPGYLSFPVVGEYFPESLRRSVARRLGHEPESPFCLWTGYGSADTGDLGIESRETIRLRKALADDPALCRELFGSDDAPMMLVPNPEAHMEVVGETLVVTKDQLVPLVRYDTGDVGGLIDREDLRGRVPEEALQGVPEKVLYVLGRTSDALVFYGTNLGLGAINEFFLSLPDDFSYGGLYEVRPKQEAGGTRYLFTIYVRSPENGAELEQRYHARLISHLKSVSNEFAAKYDPLSASMGGELIQVAIQDVLSAPGGVKHRFLVEE